MSRPTACTPRVRLAILKALRDGNYRAVACSAAGIHRSTLNDWEHRAKKGEEPFASFVKDLEVAEAKAEVDLVTELRHALKSGSKKIPAYQARARILECRWPSRWSPRVKATVEAELGALTAKLRESLDAETFKRVVNATREDAPAPGTDVGPAAH